MVKLKQRKVSELYETLPPFLTIVGIQSWNLGPHL